MLEKRRESLHEARRFNEGIVVFRFPSELEKCFGVRIGPLEFIEPPDLVFQARLLLGQNLRLLIVIPEFGLGGDVGEFVDPAAFDR